MSYRVFLNVIVSHTSSLDTFPVRIAVATGEYSNITFGTLHILYLHFFFLIIYTNTTNTMVFIQGFFQLPKIMSVVGSATINRPYAWTSAWMRLCSWCRAIDRRLIRCLFPFHTRYSRDRLRNHWTRMKRVLKVNGLVVYMSSANISGR